MALMSSREPLLVKKKRERSFDRVPLDRRVATRMDT
jgi:hypothetical protein